MRGNIANRVVDIEKEVCKECYWEMIWSRVYN
jgi:hypothetical protein